MEKTRTPNIYLAAYLKAKDCELTSVEKDGKKATFVFDGPREQIDPHIRDYENNQGQVVPLIYADEIKRLKKLAVSL